MPSIHVIYDPKDRVRHPRADELRDFKVSHVTMALSADEIAPINAADIAKNLAEQLLARIRGK